MGTSHLSFDMDIARDAPLRRSLADGAPAVLESLLEVFSARELRVQVNGDRVLHLERTSRDQTYDDSPLWFDEWVDDQDLTRCTDGPVGELIDELRDQLAGEAVHSLYVGALGALRHRPPGMEDGWYGRWKITTPPALVELVRVDLQWSSDMRAFVFDLPLEGYPFTATRLGTTEFVDREGDPATAEHNRAAIIPALAGVANALGLLPEERRWTVGGDAPGIYKDETREIRDVWLPRLRGT